MSTNLRYIPFILYQIQFSHSLAACCNKFYEYLGRCNESFLNSCFPISMKKGHLLNLQRLRYYIDKFLLLSVDRIGMYTSMCIFASFTFIGQLVVSTGVMWNSYYCILIGRFLFGCGAESATVTSASHTFFQ